MYSTPDSSEDLRPLVQAPLESPLNRAHTFSRKAEMLTKSKRYDDAIICHSKAAECLLLAMGSCTSQPMLNSMALQHQAYLSQMDRLRTKAELLDLLDNSHKTTATVSRSTQTDSVQNICADQYMKVDEDSVYELIRDNDDLMKGYLKSSERDQGIEASSMSDKSYRSINLCESDSSDGLGSEKSQNGWKLINDVQISCSTCGVKLDDVLRMNHKLGNCVASLMQELSSTHAEKKQIEERLCVTDDALTPLAEPALKFSCLNLPPLETLYPEMGPFPPESIQSD